MHKIYLALKAVIEKGGRFMILKRSEKEDISQGEWDLPGGAVEFGEEPIKALKREVKEECGIEIEVIKPVRLWTFYKNSEDTQIFGVTVLCRYKSGKIILSKEHVKSEWINPKNIKNYRMHKGIKSDIERAKEELDLQL